METVLLPAILTILWAVPIGATPATSAAEASESRPSVAVPLSVTVPAGTVLRLRLDTSVSSDRSYVEQPVRAHLTQPLVSDGLTIAQAGTLVTGEVVDARRSGRVKGRARLALRFDSIVLDGERHPLRTRTWAAVARGTKRKDALIIGGAGAGGALLGGLFGGKKGAGIGALTGGGAGTAVVLSTRGREVRLGRGAVVGVRLASPLTVERE